MLYHNFFFLFFFFTISFAELCHPNDKKALLNIKKAYNNPYTLASWKPEDDCCTWSCVKCDENSHRITSLSILHADDFFGPITSYIGDLEFLEDLTFHKVPNLIGPIPPAIAKLQNLKFLDLSWTNLSGSIPDFLGTLSNLNYIRLSFNNLTGTIPSSLSKLPNLGSLRLDRNKLTGPIPDSFGYFKTPPNLFFSHNQLSGKIPASLSKLNFDIIDLSRNKLEGDASMIFFVGQKLSRKIDLSRNLFEFNMSKAVVPKSLYVLNLNHNKIFGGLPSDMIVMGDLITFNVSYNRLCGQIPKGGELQAFDVYSYFHNKCLCGAPLNSCK